MKALIVGILFALPVMADVGPKDINPQAAPAPELENFGNMDVQMEEDQERGTEIEKHRKMEREMRKDLNEPEEDQRMQKDY